MSPSITPHRQSGPASKDQDVRSQQARLHRRDPVAVIPLRIGELGDHSRGAERGIDAKTPALTNP